MKGIVFTEFMEMVENKFSPDLLDHIITDANLPNGGAYTSVGTYDHREIVRLVLALGERSGVAVPELLQTFGQHLFGRFVVGFPRFFVDVPGTFAFLESIDRHIHVEVRKLYPDAELPSFEHDRPSADCLHLVYRSDRAMADLAQGLIEGCIEHFAEPMTLAREDLSQGRGSVVRFVVQRAPA